MKQHKHAELIKAWADGAEIQYLYAGNEWRDCTDNSPIWNQDTLYRIKPMLVALRSDLYISFRFESVEDAEKARDEIKELMK